MEETALPRILLVDDDLDFLQALRRHLRWQFDVTLAPGPDAALELAASRGPYEVVVSDLHMPGMDGIDLLSRLRTAAPRTVRILLTGAGDVDSAIAAVNQGRVFRYLTKPCPPKTLIRELAAAVKQHRLGSPEPRRKE